MINQKKRNEFASKYGYIIGMAKDLMAVDISIPEDGVSCKKH